VSPSKHFPFPTSTNNNNNNNNNKKTDLLILFFLKNKLIFMTSVTNFRPFILNDRSQFLKLHGALISKDIETLLMGSLKFYPLQQ
jgi:hypothetical protein